MDEQDVRAEIRAIQLLRKVRRQWKNKKKKREKITG